MAITGAVRRGVAVAGTCALTLAMAGAATAAASAAGGRQVRAGQRAGAGQHAGSGLVVTDVIDQVSRRIGLVGMGPGQNGHGRARLVLTTNFGRTFTGIGPRTGKVTEPDSIFFLDRDHGWFATFSVLNLAEKIYRTSDGGRTWQAFAAPMHNLAAGSGDMLQFLTPTQGYLADTEANAPAETLYRTSDGGATWHVVAALRAGQRQRPGVLPSLGRIEFEPGGMTGWLSNSLFSSKLHKTTNGGRSWRPVSLRAPSGAIRGLPAVFGRTLVEPVTVGAGGTASLRVYVSKDGGTTWSMISSLANAARPSCTGPLPTSFPEPSVGWAAAFRHHHVVVYRTTNQGLRWSATVTPAPVPSGFCGPYQIAAPGSSRAWLVTPGTPGSDETRIYATRDAGRTWRRIDLRALTAG